VSARSSSAPSGPAQSRPASSSACRSDWPAPSESESTEIASGRSRKIASRRCLTCWRSKRSGTKKPPAASNTTNARLGNRPVAAAPAHHQVAAENQRAADSRDNRPRRSLVRIEVAGGGGAEQKQQHDRAQRQHCRLHLQ